MQFVVNKTFSRLIFLGFLLAWFAHISSAQKNLAYPRFRSPTFIQLTRNSGYIFSGTVKSIAMVRPDGENGVGTVRIMFHVEHSFRGVRSGQMLEVREWAGLWESGQRYRVGERLTLFLFRPGKLGLTSQVGGTSGRFQVDPAGWVLLNGQGGVPPSTETPVAREWRGRTRLSWREFSAGLRRAVEE